MNSGQHPGRTPSCTYSRHRLAAATAGALVLALCACEVVINPGEGISISLANKLFTFTLGSVGQLQPRVGADPVRTAGVVPLFDGEPDDNPGSAVLSLDPADVQVIPLSTTRTLQGITGTVEIRVRIAPADSTSPCTEGIDVGSFNLTLVDGDVVIADGSLEVPFAAFLYLVTGQFTICLEATATVDVHVTITMIDCVFGPIVDPNTGCSSVAQCLAGFECDGGNCVPAESDGCSSSADCDAGDVCDDGDCVPVDSSACTTDADCGEGEMCDNGQCGPGEVTNCVTSADCPDGQLCLLGECIPLGPGECNTTADCDAGQTCVEGECEDMATTGACTADTDCSTGETCVDGVCTPPVGFTTATIVHRGSELIVADYEIDSSRGIQLNGQYSVVQAIVSGDGSHIWINADAQFPPDGFFRTRLYRVNIDGSGGSESPVAEANIQAGSGQPTIDTNLDGSVAVLASGFNTTIISRATPGNTPTVINDGVPCTRGAWRLTDDGSRIVWASFCNNNAYTLVVDTGANAPVEIADDEAFMFSGRPLGSFDPGTTEFDISADGEVWVPQANFSDEDSNFLPTLAIGMGLTSPVSITYQPGVDPDLSSISSVNITDDGDTVGYCAGFLDLATDRCYVHDVGSATSFEFADLDGITPIQRMVLADNGTRAYVQTTDNSPYGYFQTVGQTDRLIGGTGMFFAPAARLFNNATLSDDGMTLAAPYNGRAYVLRDGVDGLPGFPAIESIQYSFDDAAGTMTVRVNVSPADGVGNVIMQPLHTGMEPTRHIPEEENPFFAIRFGQPLTETAEGSGVWEHTVNLGGKKAFLNANYSLRVGAADTANNRASFQDFVPVE